MKIADAVVGIAAVPYAAYWVWLAVRIVNNRESRVIRRAILLALVSLIIGLAYVSIPRVQ